MSTVQRAAVGVRCSETQQQARQKCQQAAQFLRIIQVCLCNNCECSKGAYQPRLCSILVCHLKGAQVDCWGLRTSSSAGSYSNIILKNSTGIFRENSRTTFGQPFHKKYNHKYHKWILHHHLHISEDKRILHWKDNKKYRHIRTATGRHIRSV